MTRHVLMLYFAGVRGESELKSTISARFPVYYSPARPDTIVEKVQFTLPRALAGNVIMWSKSDFCCKGTLSECFSSSKTEEERAGSAEVLIDRT